RAVGPTLVWSPRRGQPLRAVGPTLVWSPRRGQPLRAVGPTLVWSPRRGQPLRAVGPTLVWSPRRGQLRPGHDRQDDPRGPGRIVEHRLGRDDAVADAFIPQPVPRVQF